MKQPLFFSIILLMIVGSCSKKVLIEESAGGAEIPVPALVEKKPYTSTHIFEAKLKNVEFYVCTALTSACPKTYGASGDYARFEVTGVSNIFS